MGERGPKSVDALMVSSTNSLALQQRADAPYDLNDDEAEEWRAIVGAMAPDWFMRANHQVLAQLCRHIVAARVIARCISDYTNPKNKSFNFREYAALLEQQRAESSAIMRLSRSMRLTQQAITKPQMAKHPRGQTIVAPWSRDHEE